jgi:hypothetical protein
MADTARYGQAEKSHTRSRTSISDDGMEATSNSNHSDSDKEKTTSAVPALPTLTLRNDNYPHGGDLLDPANGADGTHDGYDQDGEVIKADIPWRYRLLAFSMILFFATSSSFCENTLGPLKSTLVKELKISSELEYLTSFSSSIALPGLHVDPHRKWWLWPVARARLELTLDAQYGAIASASSLVNTILPIIGGIGMDYVSGCDLTCQS